MIVIFKNKDFFISDTETNFPAPKKKDLEELKNNVFNFLKQIRPNLNTEKDTAIEIRLLRRDKKSLYLGSFIVRDFNKYTQSRFLDFLTKVQEIPYCMYYSVYSFNPNILPESNREIKEITKIAKNNAIDTSILVADFDDISEEDFEEEYINFISLDIEPSITLFSGHGYQCIWLIEKTTDKNILKKFTKGLLSSGFKVDSKIKDCARLMRIPGSFNYKDKNNPIDTYIMGNNKKDLKTYSVEHIFSKLNTKNEPEETFINNTFTIKELEEKYPMLNFSEIPTPIIEMLKGFRKGYANNVLMFLTLYFRELGYSKGKIKSIVKVLSTLGSYPWSEEEVFKEVDRFFYNRNYSAKSIYFSALKEYGYIDFNFINNEKLKIDNYIISDIKNISNKSFVVYLCMLIENHHTKKEKFTIKEISDLVKISTRHIKTRLDELIKIGLIDKQRSNKKEGGEYQYFINKYAKFTDLGFTNFHIATLKLLLKQLEYKEINETQLVICLYLKHKCYHEKDYCFLTQEKIAEDLGLNRSTISKSFIRIEELKLITRSKVNLSDFQYRYDYFINF